MTEELKRVSRFRMTKNEKKKRSHGEKHPAGAGKERHKKKKKI